MARIEVLLADVDGTLVTQEKVLTEQASAAARELRAHGVKLAVTSGRPPRGMRMLIEPLALDTAIAGFNGGVLVNPDMTVIETRTLDPEAARTSVDLLRGRGRFVGEQRNAALAVGAAEPYVVLRQRWRLLGHDEPRQPEGLRRQGDDQQHHQVECMVYRGGGRQQLWRRW